MATDDLLGTPGPWLIRQLAHSKGYRVYAANGKATIAEVPAGHVAEAYLIAAAPDLLAAALRLSLALAVPEVGDVEAAGQELEQAIAEAMPMLMAERAENLPADDTCVQRKPGE
mgnify:CR=1 FL=1